MFSTDGAWYADMDVKFSQTQVHELDFSTAIYSVVGRMQANQWKFN